MKVEISEPLTSIKLNLLLLSVQNVLLVVLLNYRIESLRMCVWYS